MACQADPEFGLPGYFSRMCVERTYIMKSQLLDLQRNLDRHNEFAPYIKAREGILSLGAVDRGGRECFLKIEALFFEEFLASFSTALMWRAFGYNHNTYLHHWRKPDPSEVVPAIVVFS